MLSPAGTIAFARHGGPRHPPRGPAGRASAAHQAGSELRPARLAAGDRPDAVRDRAHAAVAGLGPATDLSESERAAIADYLLGQQSESEREGTRLVIAGSDSAQAWARGASEALRRWLGGALPDIPSAEGAPPAEPEAAPEPARAPAREREPEPAAYEEEPPAYDEAPTEEAAAADRGGGPRPRARARAWAGRFCSAGWASSSPSSSS